ncbi:MAG: BamA/TamA family outer membrane protein [Polyangia bacterium]
MKRAAALVVLLVSVFGVSGPRSAWGEKLEVRRRYEETLVKHALHDTRLVVEPLPLGKTIEDIVIVANDVIQPGDYGIPYRIPIVYPLLSRVSWLNHLHVRTRDYIIRQELLFKVGEKYRADVAAETARNLRSLFILAVARIVVTRGSTPDRIVILIVTKDQWTLRLNTDFVIDQSRLDSLAMSISESNVAGRNKTVSVQYALDPGRHTIGLGWIDPRINRSRHQLQLLGDVFLRRSTSMLEGGYASFITGRPLYSLRTQWGWQLDGSFLQDIARTFQGGSLRALKYNDELIPDAYARRQMVANLAGTRSFGVLDKLNLTLGFRVTSTRSRLPTDFPTTLSAGARAAYIAYLPRSESASGPYLAAVAYRASFVRLQNIQTFALSEDFRLGPKASFEIRFADPLFGFSSRFWAFSASYGATYWGRDNMITFSLSVAARLQGGIKANQSWVNQVYDASFHETTPRFGPFRLHIAGALEMRRNDLANTRVSLGLDSGLRGFDTRYFIGNNFYRANIELRSIALNLWTLHVGGVLFYDGGDAPSSLLTAGYHQDAGVGLRILFPQFDRQVLRLDLAFPFERGSGGVYGPRFSVGFGQAF